MSPLRLFHSLPVAEGLQAEVEHPLGLALLCRYKAHDILGQTVWYDFSVHVCGKAVFILLFRHAADKFVFLCHVLSSFG